MAVQLFLRIKNFFIQNYQMEIYKTPSNDIPKSDPEKSFIAPKNNILPSSADPEGEVELEEIVQQLFDIFSSGLADSTNVAQLISIIASNSNKLASQHIVESHLVPNILSNLDQDPSPFLLKSISDLIYYSPQLTHIVFQHGYLNLIYDLILKPNEEISHHALKFIRRIIPIGIENRAVLFASEFVDVILKLFEQKSNPGQFVYAAHTVALFVIYDPVYGSNSYSNNGSSLPNRSTVLDQCLDLSFPPKAILAISNFLKFGHAPRIHKSLYRFIHLLLFEIQYENLNFYGVLMSEFLSNYCENNASRIAEFTHCNSYIENGVLKKTNTNFFEFARYAIELPSLRIQISVFNIIRNILYYRANFYEKSLQKHDPFQMAYNYLCCNDAPIQLRIACARCLFYAAKYLLFVYQNLLSPEILNALLQIYFGDTPMLLRNQISCLVIILGHPVLSKSRECRGPIIEALRPLLTHDEVLISFVDLLDNFDKEQLYAVLEFFKLLTEIEAEKMRTLLIPENIIDQLESLLEYANDKAQEIILYLLDFFTSDDEEDN